MPNLMKYEFPVQSDLGNLVTSGVTITVRPMGALGTFASLFADRAGTIPMTNPFTGSPGFVAGNVVFYVANGLYRIQIASASYNRTWDNIAIGTVQEYDIEDLAFDALKIPSTTTYAGVTRFATRHESALGLLSDAIINPDGLDAGHRAFGLKALPRGYINGGILSNNALDAANDIDISAGVCRDSTNTRNITMPARTKRLDAPFNAGTNQGMRHSTAIADDTFHIYAIMTADETSVDYFATNVYGNPTLAPGYPSTYIYYRYIMSIIRHGSIILPFIQQEDEVIYTAPNTDLGYVDNAPGTINALRTMQAIPNGLQVFVWLTVYHSAANGIFINHGATGPSATKSSTATFSQMFFSSYHNVGTHGKMDFMALSNNIKQLVIDTGSNNLVRITIRGWRCPRGKDA